MRPHVVLHNAVSADSRLLPYNMVEMAVYYGMVAGFREQATLVGSETLLTAGAFEVVPDDDDDAVAPQSEPGDSRPLLVVPDSRGRVRTWCWLLSQPYWRAGVALCAESTPADYLAYLERIGVKRIVAGLERVNAPGALEELASCYSIERVRVDSGGTLNGILLRNGLVGEISLLIAPVLMGDEGSRPFFHALDGTNADGIISLRLTHCERVERDLLWLRYEVVG